MKVLVVGLGSIARRHIKNIKSIKPDSQIAILRQHSKASELGEVASLVDGLFFSASNALKWRPDITFVTNPATMHRETALMFAQQNSHLFIEKPLSVDISGLDELLKECRKRKLVVMVGYVLRFSEPLQVIKKILREGRIGRILSVSARAGMHLSHWRPTRRYQDTVSAANDLGGGVLFELSHELDYMRWLAGEVSQIYASVGKVSDLDIDVEDIAEIFLKFKNGALGNLHLDMVDYAANRWCRITGAKGTIVWDSVDADTVKLYLTDTGKWKSLRPKKKTDRNAMYKAELKHFFDCIAHKQEPLISGKEGKRVVELILAAKRSAETGEVVSL